jgi:hypothetical protein
MQYPMGGMDVSNLDVRAVEMFGDVTHVPGTFTPTTSARLYPKGTLLGRLTDGNLTPYTTDNNPAGSGTFVGVLGSAVQATLLDAMEIRFIADGKVNFELLAIDDTSASQVITETIKDDMRRQGITPLDVRDLTKLDNQ